MIHFNVLELVLRDPSRLTDDLAGHTPHSANGRQTVRAPRRTRRLIRRQRFTAER
jgi:hypothetical protein